VRRKAREIALQVLFQKDLRECSLGEVLRYTELPEEWDEETRAFFFQLVRGVDHNLDFIDAVLAKTVERWSLGRMMNVDRNILRMATFEIMFMPDIPVGVAINEAVELGKKYGSEESGKFINGVLAKLVKKIECKEITVEESSK
jgi:N utilization substance protein B